MMKYNQILRKLRPFCLVCFTLALGLVSCRQDDSISPNSHTQSQTESKVPFSLLSVRSYAEGGATLGLDLNLDFSDQNLRSITYLENAETGELSSIQVATTEKIHLFLRKEGDDQSLVMATVTWQGRSNNKLRLDKININLPDAYNINTGEKWYVMGILGGELDETTKSIRMGGTEANIAIKEYNVVDMPYCFGWKLLTITDKNKASIEETAMTPRGALLRLNFYNNASTDYSATSIKLRSNALQAKGRFYPFATSNDSSQTGKQAEWRAETNGTELQTYSYPLTKPLSLPSGASHTSERTVMLWAMPTNVADADRQTEILLADAQGAETKTYSKKAHRALKEGNSYRLTNALDLSTWTGDAGSGGNIPMDGSKLTSPIEPIKVLSGTASELHQKDPQLYKMEYSFDGDNNTFYHSRDRSAGPKLPITLTYNFDKAYTLSHIVYVPRDQNGSINAYNLIVTYEDGTQGNISMPNLGSPTKATKITWEGISSKKIKQVSFVVRSTHYGVLAVREMEFYQIPDSYFDPSPYFTDLACTELRKDITYQQILAIPDVYYREMARKMYQGTYTREFRIADYKAWTNPSYQQRINKNQFPYSLHDNPTGIYFTSGETAVIFVGDTKGQSIRLKVMDPELTGFNGTSYELRPGINKLKLSSSGLGYILYHVDEVDVNRTSHPDIRVHFPEGTGFVNGYFDTEKESHRGRWKELLGKAKAKHFDVLGQYAHLTYNTEYFVKNTPDITPLMTNYDNLVGGEMALMGLLRRGQTTHKPFRNRMLFLRVYEKFMYATLHRTGYNLKSANEGPTQTLTNANVQKQWAWGVAHEVGHMNQTIGLNWGGMIEITNNIHSFYIEHYIFEDSSRSLRAARNQGTIFASGSSNFYNPAWNALLETEKTLSTESKDVNSLVPFLQLQMYFGSVKGQTPTKENGYDGFYPKLYQYLREANYTNKKDAADNGYQQTELTYHASRAAGYDLTEFFERWGFYRLADNVEFANIYNNKFRITVKQSVVDNVKQRIQALGLPKLPKVAFEYITPQNKDLFRNPQAVVRGANPTKSVKETTTTFTLKGWQNVVAWEIRDASGKLLHTDTGGYGKPGETASISFNNWSDTYILNAIDAQGTKTRVNIQ